MRLLITGASGLLGLNMALRCAAAQQVTGVARGRLVGVPFDYRQADLTDFTALPALLDDVQPDAVIHCAALADVDACEKQPDLAQRVNADLPGELARLCAARGVRLVHLSTDAVFDGTKAGFYSEEDAPNPLSVYARSKLAGERAVLEALPEAIVARVNFFGWSASGRRSLAEFFFRNLQAGQRVRGFTDVHFCPLFVGDLSDLLLSMLDKGLRGLYHVVGSQALSKYDFGVALAQQFGFDPGLIEPVSVERAGLAARRSHNLRLSVHKLSTDLGQVVPDVYTGLAHFYTQYTQGYPQQLQRYPQPAV